MIGILSVFASSRDLLTPNLTSKGTTCIYLGRHWYSVSLAERSGSCGNGEYSFPATSHMAGLGASPHSVSTTNAPPADFVFENWTKDIPVIVTGVFDKQSAEQAIVADFKAFNVAIGFGRPFASA